MSHLAQRGRKAIGENIGAVYAKDNGRHISTAKGLSASDGRAGLKAIRNGAWALNVTFKITTGNDPDEALL